MKNGRDPFLEKRVVQYDRWLKKGRIAHASRVVPVAEAFSAQQWVLPSEQAMAILRRADTVAVQNCECRSHYRRCNHPLEVCFLLNAVGRKLVVRGEARPVTLKEAEGILATANRSGLVHLSLYRPDHEVYALCSCCACCCHDLQIMKRYGRHDLTVRSEYVAVTRQADCLECGRCADRCVFDARVFPEGVLVYNPEVCLGCGLCVTTCPGEAIAMELREGARVNRETDGGSP